MSEDKKKKYHGGGCPNRWGTMPAEKKQEFIDWCNDPTNTKGRTPSEMCLKIGVLCKDTLMEYARAFPEFGELYAREKLKRENYILESALEGKSNPIIARFVLCCNYGYVTNTDKKNIKIKEKELKLKEKEVEHKLKNGNLGTENDNKLNITLTVKDKDDNKKDETKEG